MRNCLISFIITLFSICSIGSCYVVPNNTTMEQFANLSIADVSGEALEILTEGFEVVADLTVYQVARMLHTRVPYVLNDSVVFLDNDGNILASGGGYIEGDPDGQLERSTLAEAQAEAVNQELYIYDELEQDISNLIAEAYASWDAGHGADDGGELNDGGELERRGNPLNYICGFNMNNHPCRSFKNCNREWSPGSGKKCGCLSAGRAKLCATYKPR